MRKCIHQTEGPCVAVEYKGSEVYGDMVELINPRTGNLMARITTGAQGDLLVETWGTVKVFKDTDRTAVIE